jgi:hypothetical protein
MVSNGKISVLSYQPELKMTEDLGESLANVFLSRKTSEGHLFRTTMIGGKWPTVDIYAEVISNDMPRMFCFFQVKTTNRGYTKRQKNLKVSIDLPDLIKLSKYCAPSYLIGIDHDPFQPFSSKAFIVTVRGIYTKRLSSLSTKYPLTEQSLIELRNEVVAFWTKLNPSECKENYWTNFII